MNNNNNVPIVEKTPIIIDVFDNKNLIKCKPNNWLKMHHKPMRRKPLKRLDANLIIIGKTGRGMSFSNKLQILHENKM